MYWPRHVLTQAECYMACLGVIHPVGIEFQRIRKGFGVSTGDVEGEPEHRILRKHDAAELHFIAGEARYRTGIEVAQGLFEDLGAIIMVATAALIDIGVLQQQIHRVSQHVLRGVVASDKEEDEQICELPQRDAAFVGCFYEQVERSSRLPDSGWARRSAR